MLLDTNAISAWAQNDVALLRPAPGDRPWRLPCIALGECRYGLLKSSQRAFLEAWLSSVEAICVILSADAETARHYAEIRLELEKGRTPIPYHDIWIAALAIQHDLPVVTRDAHFDRISGICRIGW